jgi:hypothetical protein
MAQLTKTILQNKCIDKLLYKTVLEMPQNACMDGWLDANMTVKNLQYLAFIMFIAFGEMRCVEERFGTDASPLCSYSLIHSGI